MNALTNVYAYSKNKSQAMFSSKKQKKMLQEKKGDTWVKTCCMKYEETKKASHAYMMIIYKKVKSSSNNVYTTLSTFTFTKDGKYANYPWYTRLYLILKDSIKRIIKIEDGDVSMNATEEEEKTEKVQTEEPHTTLISTRGALNGHTSQNAYVAHYYSNIIHQRHKNHLKRTNSEIVEERANTAVTEKKCSSHFGFNSRGRTASLINSIISLNKFTHVVEEEKPTALTGEINEVNGDGGINDKSITADYSSRTGTAEIDTSAKISISNKSDSDKTYLSDVTDSKRKNFNIKNAWTKFNNLLI